MLGYAARTLLSKTLQRFLSKYLVDIDVQDLTIPTFLPSSSSFHYYNESHQQQQDEQQQQHQSSSSSSSDNNNSWGLKLSNVKLRDGVHLMSLPGLRKTVRRRVVMVKKKRKVPKNGNIHNIHNDNINRDNRENDNINNENVNDDNVNNDNLNNDKISEENNDLVSPSHHSSMQSQEQEHEYEQEQLTMFCRIRRKNSYGFLTTPKSDTTTNTNSNANTNTAPPNLPSSSSITLDHNNHTIHNLDDNHGNRYYDDDGPKSRFRSDNFASRRRKAVFPNKSIMGAASASSSISTTTTRSTNTSTSTTPPIHHHKPHHDNHSNQPPKIQGYEYEEYEEEEIVEEIIQHHMTLRTGKGGKVGVLHVKIVEKELHITMEDADLVVEAVPLPTTSSQSKDQNGTTANIDSDTDSSNVDSTKTNPNEAPHPKNDTKISTQTDAATKKATDKSSLSSSSQLDNNNSEQKQDDATTGEKVTKRNALAKMMSLIPNLFLTDCRLRIIVRDETTDHIYDHTNNNSNNKDELNTSSSRNNVSNEGNGDASQQQEYQYGKKDIVFVIGIDFLSVTSEGQDFLAHVRSDHDSSCETSRNDTADDECEEDKQSSSPLCSKIKTIESSSLNETKQPTMINEFLTKRIRTGKGPEGGIWLKVFPTQQDEGLRHPLLKAPNNLEVERLPCIFHNDSEHNYGGGGGGGDCAGDGQETNSDTKQNKWAWIRFIEKSQMTMFRCSGIDLHSRILLGSKSKSELRANSAESFFSDDLEDCTVDSMLFGMDYVGEMGATSLLAEELRNDKTILQEGNDVDAVQSIPVKSSFHRIAKGFKKRACLSDHCPLEECLSCWDDSNSSYELRNGPDCVKKRHDHDTHGDSTNDDKFMANFMPLPGFVIYLAVSGPLEINVSRQMLESVGTLKSLFSKNSSPSLARGNENNNETNDDKNVELLDNTLNHKMNSEQTKSSTRSAVPSNAFPSTMQPDLVNVTGVHLANVLIRLHVMHPEGCRNEKYSFCYWKIETKSITIDMQNLLSEELQIQDLKVEVARLHLFEMKGAETNKMFSLGMDSLHSNGERHEDENITSESIRLCAAADVLNVTAPWELSAKRNPCPRALQLRLLKIIESNTVGCFDAKIGPCDIDMPWSFKEAIFDVKDEAMSAISGEERMKSKPAPSPAEESTTCSQSCKSDKANNVLWEYCVLLDGGSLALSPTLRCSFPSTKVSGRKVSPLGILVETFLDGMKFEYGKRSLDLGNDIIPLSRLRDLPDNVRMGILLFLDDLKPLQKVFNVRNSPNNFMLCHALNKKIGSNSVSSLSRIMQRQPLHKRGTTNKRKMLLKKISELDDETLERLLEKV